MKEKTTIITEEFDLEGKLTKKITTITEKEYNDYNYKPYWDVTPYWNGIINGSKNIKISYA